MATTTRVLHPGGPCIGVRSLPLVLFLASLAGCLTSGSDPAPDSIDLGDGTTVDFADEVEKTATLGAIAGVIVDPAIRPIGGVDVQIIGHDRATTSNAAGAFGFSGLEPGLYSLQTFAVPGFLPVQASVEVQANAVAKVRMVMPFDPAPQPYHQTHAFAWYDDSGVVLVDFLLDFADRLFLNDSLPDACDKCFFEFEADSPPDAIILEALWEDSVEPPLGPSSFYWNVDSPDVADYADDYCSSPCRVELPMDIFVGATRFALSMGGDEGWITLQQEAEIFVTLWYHGLPPEEWSFVAGDG